jgi:hypothetical protein
LGAYQAGVYQALAEADLHPDWVAGISIGAINSALIAGNPPEKRVRRPRDLGIPEEARQSEGLPRERDAALHPALRLGALRHRHHGLQALRARSRAAAQKPGQAQLHDQDHPVRRLHAAHLRTGALLPRGRDGEGAWSGPATLQFFDHAMCDVNRLPVREVVSASHFVTDLTLGLGEVVFDYLAK